MGQQGRIGTRIEKGRESWRTLSDFGGGLLPVVEGHILE